MLCDLCGKESDLFRARIEGSELTVCKNCSRFGKVLGSVSQGNKNNPKSATQPAHLQLKQVVAQEPEEFIVANFAALIRHKREQLKLNQEDFAKLLNEKVSLIYKLETGNFEIPIELAAKFEKILHIKLIEIFKDPDIKSQSNQRDGFTLGDFITIKQKKLNK